MGLGGCGGFVGDEGGSRVGYIFLVVVVEDDIREKDESVLWECMF